MSFPLPPGIGFAWVRQSITDPRMIERRRAAIARWLSLLLMQEAVA